MDNTNTYSDHHGTSQNTSNDPVDSSLLHGKIAVALAIIKSKPNNLTGEEYTHILVRKFQSRQQDLLNRNMELKYENLSLKQQMSLTEMTQHIASPLKTFQESENLQSSQINSDYFHFPPSYYSALLSISLHWKETFNPPAHSLIVSNPIILESVNTVFLFTSKFLENQTSLTKEQLDVLEHIALLCDYYWEKQQQREIACQCINFVGYLLEELMNKPNTHDFLEQIFIVISKLATSKFNSLAIINLLIIQIQHFIRTSLEVTICDPFVHSTLFYHLKLLKISLQYNLDTLSVVDKVGLVKKLKESEELISDRLTLFKTYVLEIIDFLASNIPTDNHRFI